MPQSLSSVHIHFVFATRERRPFLMDDGIRSQMHAYIASILKAYDSTPVIVGGAEDHVHILCLLSRNHPLSKIVGEVKRNSTKWIKAKGMSYREFSWQGGYGAFSVSKSNTENVIKYIKDQQKHHKKHDFKVELLALLKNHGIEYDERYLWD